MASKDTSSPAFIVWVACPAHSSEDESVIEPCQVHLLVPEKAFRGACAASLQRRSIMTRVSTSSSVTPLLREGLSNRAFKVRVLKELLELCLISGPHMPCSDVATESITLRFGRDSGSYLLMSHSTSTKCEPLHAGPGVVGSK